MDAPRPPWALFAALFALVSLGVYGLAQWQPFAPGAPSAEGAALGDPVRGEAVFARSCATCHGDGGSGGGVGPELVDRGLGADQVAGVVAAGRGVMPAGIVSGAEAADVAAYVAQISGGVAGAATTPGAPDPPTAAGRATFTGPRLSGLRVQLDAPAPSNWTVWIEGPGGRLRVDAIPAGERESDAALVDGGESLVGRYDRVLVGADAQSPALVGSLPAARAQELHRLLVEDSPGGAPVVDLAAGQVEILREHVRFLALARDEGNLANVRFHGEHMVNITRGEPLQDVDGNGEASNPGDGVGLIDGRGAYLRRVALLSGPALTDGDRAAAAVTETIAELGARAGQAATVAEAAPDIAAIVRADATLEADWARLRTRAEESAVIELEPA